MESLVLYGIYACMLLAALSLVALVIFGIRNLTYGKVDVLTVVLVLLPVAIMVVLGLINGDWTLSGIIAMLIMLAVTAVTLLLSGLRGLIS